MNNQQFQTYWTNLQPKIKQKWSKFTDQDFKQINGQKDKFLSQLQQKYGINKDQAERELVELSKTFAGASSAVKPGASNSSKPAGTTPNSKTTPQPKKK